MGGAANNKCDKFVPRKFVVYSQIFRGTHSFFEAKHQHFDAHKIAEGEVCLKAVSYWAVFSLV